MRVLLADDESRVRSALRLLLEQEPELSVVGEAAVIQDLLALVKATNPDLILLDWELPGLQARHSASNLAPLLPVLRANFPDVAVIALSGRPEARQVALAAGVDDFVSKGDPPERLLAAVGNCGPHQSRRPGKR